MFLLYMTVCFLLFSMGVERGVWVGVEEGWGVGDGGGALFGRTNRTRDINIHILYPSESVVRNSSRKDVGFVSENSRIVMV